MMTPDICRRVKEFADSADALLLKETLDMVLDAAMDPARAAVLEDAFYCDLEFGTGGLRGIMGAGTNRMNSVVVARATQGLASYVLRAAGPGASVVIAYDSRLNSQVFAREAACVLAGNGLTACLFSDVRPTPELSFAVRHLGATAGIVITASHNPKEYNGYKVSWNDGGQVIAPHDKAIIAEVRGVTGGASVRSMPYDEALAAGRIRLLGPEMDDAFIAAMDAVRMRQALTQERGSELKIVYTPLHGVGARVVPKALTRWGFSHLILEPSQSEPDGNFPTTKSPNPEEQAAMELSLQLARREQADIILATDPDADRLGIAVRHGGDYQLLTGNQTGALLAWYIAETLREQGRLPGNGVMITTIVTTGLIEAVASAYGISVDYCLTGFKWIASLMRGYEEAAAAGRPSKTFLMGCEESYGYLVGTHARDKDAVVTACVVAEMALWAKTRGQTLVDVLFDLYARYGVHLESQLSKTMPGKAGMEQIARLMESLRSDPPRSIGGLEVREIVDIASNEVIEAATGARKPGPGLPASNVLSFELADGSRVVARPSGTEPKIKFYFMVVDKQGLPVTDTAALTAKMEACRAKEQRLRTDFDALAAARAGS
ncbi:MAG: phospho-sugar mutase [Candidatus Sumerlaeaceae bacterium]|nr:phospho-sugar mutase [Candidatus Sumerlaeaceae bacterium]